RDFSQRFNADAQRSDGSGNPHVKALGGFTREARARKVNLGDFVGEAVAGQPKRIGAECVGLDDVGACLQVLVMNVADQIGLRKVKLVITAIDENALGVK